MLTGDSTWSTATWSIVFGNCSKKCRDISCSLALPSPLGLQVPPSMRALWGGEGEVLIESDWPIDQWLGFQTGSHHHLIFPQKKKQLCLECHHDYNHYYYWLGHSWDLIISLRIWSINKKVRGNFDYTVAS